MRGGYFTHDEVVLDLVRLAPCTHHERIIVRNYYDLIDSLGLEGILLLEEGRDVLLGAGGGEGAGDGNEDDLLLLEFCKRMLVTEEEQGAARDWVVTAYLCWPRT